MRTALLALALAVLAGPAHAASAAPPLPVRFGFGLGLPDGVNLRLTVAASQTVLIFVGTGRMMITSKSGAGADAVPLDYVFRPVLDRGEAVAAPRVLYDSRADRFFIVSTGYGSSPGCPPGTCVSHYLVAVSRTSKPASLHSNSHPEDWFLYSLDAARDNDVYTSNVADLADVSVTDDDLMITSRLYNRLTGRPEGSKIRILDKMTLLRGEPIAGWVDVRDNVLGRVTDRLYPATNLSPSDSGFFVMAASSACSFVVWKLTNGPSGPSVTSTVVDDTGVCELPPDPVQPGGSRLSTSGFSPQAVYRDGHLWVTNTIGKDFGSGRVAAVYVAEIDVSQWPKSVRTIQSGVIGEDRAGSAAPAIMVDRSHNVALVYARSSETEFLSAYSAGRLATDPPNTFRPPQLLKNGAALLPVFAQSLGSAMDPVDGSIWLLGLYAKSDRLPSGWTANFKLGTRLLPGSTDVNDDGHIDLLWQHQTDGRTATWLMQGTQRLEGFLLSPPGGAIDTNWKIVGTADFNGDGESDLLWRHQTEGWVSVWLMASTVQTAGVPLTPGRVADTNWRIAATGDFNRDGHPDIVWQNEANGLVSAWLMNGTTLVDGVLLTPDSAADTNWKIVGSGDFNRDGWLDLVWQHQGDGRIAVWKMRGTMLVEGDLISPGQVDDLDWKIRAVGDFNRDGMPDLIWQHRVTGDVSAWLMNGTTMMAGISLGQVPDTNWQISGPR